MEDGRRVRDNQSTIDNRQSTMPWRVLVVTNLWPEESDPSYGCFVKAQMESLRPLGVEYDVLFINGRASRWNYLRAFPQMWGRLMARRYDLIHAHMGLAGLVARGQISLPLVVSFVGFDVAGEVQADGRVSAMGRFYQASSFLLARLASAVIVKTAELKRRLRLDTAQVIPNGVDLNLFQPGDRTEARQILGLSAQKKFVLFPYDPQRPEKRFDLVEAAVAEARRTVPDLEILPVFGVPQNRVPLYMNAADMLVLASQYEGSPNSVKEAMATNLPVVTVDVGDAAEVIGQTKGCYVVPREAGEIAAKIVEICRQGKRTQGRGRMGRRSIENVARQVVEVYSKVLGRRL
jgi:glycosyltransferase involved in cell wall biosynthesis